jgi:kynurenine formamidase
MANIIKVRCNGPGKHVNEVNLDKVLQTEVVLRTPGRAAGQDLPERLVFPCRQCTEGKVIVTRTMLEEQLGKRTP